MCVRIDRAGLRSKHAHVIIFERKYSFVLG